MYQIKTLNLGHSNYPEKLLHIYSKPNKLYVIGDETILNEKSIAVIGCRDCSRDGAKTAYSLSYELAKKGIVVISGLARGIDTCSHKGTVDAKGKTIAILGSGLDVIYPKENRELYKKIIDTGGAIVSEYPMRNTSTKTAFSGKK